VALPDIEHLELRFGGTSDSGRIEFDGDDSWP
jgi:hypothetical protein